MPRRFTATEIAQLLQIAASGGVYGAITHLAKVLGRHRYTLYNKIHQLRHAGQSARRLSPEEQRWVRSIAYWGKSANDPENVCGAIQMAKRCNRDAHTIFQAVWLANHQLGLGMKPERYPDRLDAAGVYTENGLLYREVMAGIYAEG